MTSLVGKRRVVLLGDTDIDTRRDELTQIADDRGCEIVDAYAFEPSAPLRHDDLVDVDAVPSALGRALRDRIDVWVPWVMVDFARDQHIRRMILVLERYGLQLRVGRELTVLDADGALNEVDFALRAEVRAVENLANAALAVAGVEKLSAAIEKALVESDARATAAVTAARPRTVEAGTGRPGEVAGPPVLPAPHGPWRYRKPLLSRYARWLVHDCGVTRAATARVLNASGQRTHNGKPWQPTTVRRLLDEHTA